MERVRLVDVATAAGVHPATASRALNPIARSGVAQDTVRRVEIAARRLAYVPNATARSLRTSRSFLAAFVVPDITNALFPPLVRGAEQALSEAGFTLVLTDTNNDADTEATQIAAMRAHGVDGFIIATARWEDPMLDQLARDGVPTVLVNRRDSSAVLPYVGADDRRGIQLCVEHLLALGHRRIVHFAGPSNTSTGRDRLAAFNEHVHTLRLSGAATVIHCDAFTEEAGEKAAQALLASSTRFTAVLAANDLLALGALGAFRAAGLKCPDDVSVTGFNDLHFMDRITPAMTTVRVPLPDMGRQAAKVLVEWTQQPQRRRSMQLLLPVSLVVRGTTGPVPRTKRRDPHQ